MQRNKPKISSRFASNFAIIMIGETHTDPTGSVLINTLLPLIKKYYPDYQLVYAVESRFSIKEGVLYLEKKCKELKEKIQAKKSLIEVNKKIMEVQIKLKKNKKEISKISKEIQIGKNELISYDNQLSAWQSDLLILNTILKDNTILYLPIDSKDSNIKIRETCLFNNIFNIVEDKTIIVAHLGSLHILPLYKKFIKKHICEENLFSYVIEAREAEILTLKLDEVYKYEYQNGIVDEKTYKKKHLKLFPNEYSQNIVRLTCHSKDLLKTCTDLAENIRQNLSYLNPLNDISLSSIKNTPSKSCNLIEDSKYNFFTQSNLSEKKDSSSFILKQGLNTNRPK